MIKDLILSYKNTISTMDLRLVKPFTETEIQPIYSDEWIKIIKHIINVCKEQKLSKKEIIDCFPNVSTISSMLIMDIFDLYYAKSNKKTIKKVISFYNLLLNTCYKEDKFSLYSNKPIHMDYHIKFNSEKYMKYMKNKSNFKNISLYCFLMAFELYQDIFSDNCYEVMGPFYERNKVFIVKEFHNIPSKDFNNIRIIEIHNIKNIIGTEKIDLFAHSTFTSNDCKLVIEVDNKIYKGNINNILNIIKEITFKYKRMNRMTTLIDKKKMSFKHRYFRYINLLDRSLNIKKINILLETIPLHKREYNKDKLVNIIATVLKKGDFID